MLQKYKERFVGFSNKTRFLPSERCHEDNFYPFDSVSQVSTRTSIVSSTEVLKLFCHFYPLTNVNRNIYPKQKKVNLLPGHNEI